MREDTQDKNNSKPVFHYDRSQRLKNSRYHNKKSQKRGKISRIVLLDIILLVCIYSGLKIYLNKTEKYKIDTYQVEIDSFKQNQFLLVKVILTNNEKIQESKMTEIIYALDNKVIKTESHFTKESSITEINSSLPFKNQNNLVITINIENQTKTFSVKL